ncbi:MAG: DUF748 domain-containing protein [Candidatus Omnitrophica bacterium]|nr:DUF748 domain-containing protein [Candidatus Omnitrophota bacterium]
MAKKRRNTREKEVNAVQRFLLRGLGWTFLCVAGLMLLGYAAVFVYVNTQGERIFLRGLKEQTGIEATVESVSLRFPFTLSVRTLESETISCRTLNAVFLFYHPARREIVFRKVYLEGARIQFRREGERIVLPLPKIKKKGEDRYLLKKPEQARLPEVSQEEAAEPPPYQIVARKIILKDSDLVFEDRSSEEPFRAVLENVQAELKDFSYAEKPSYQVDLRAGLRAGSFFSERAVKIRGWADHRERHMDLEFQLDRIRYRAFAHYYPPFWKPEHLGIKNAVLSFASRWTAENNNLVVDSTLTLDQIEYVQVQEGEEKNATRNLKTILALLRGPREKPVLNFKIKTKMDEPKFDLSSIQADIGKQIKIGPAMLFENFFGKVKSGVNEGVEETKEMTVDRAVDVLKEAGEGIVDTMKEMLGIE